MTPLPIDQIPQEWLDGREILGRVIVRRSYKIWQSVRWHIGSGHWVRYSRLDKGTIIDRRCQCDLFCELPKTEEGK